MKFRIFAGFFICVASTSVAGAQIPSNPRLCIVPVANGAPNEADISQVWRMIPRVYMLPGIPRPVIYAHNRGGVWTVDEQRRFVHFGGTFPANSLFDKFAQDPVTGRIAAISNVHGIQVIDRGETAFRQVAAIDRKTLHHPHDIKFVARFGSFVISDPGGVYLLDRANNLSLLSTVDNALLKSTTAVFDLPSVGALLLNASSVALRYDNGDVLEVLKLDRGNFVKNASVSPDLRTLTIETQRKTEQVPLPQRSASVADASAGAGVPPILEVRSKQIPGTRPADTGRFSYVTAFSAAGKTLLYSESGLFELQNDGSALRIDVPFDPIETKIETIAELPDSGFVLIFTGTNIYALDATGAFTIVPGGTSVGSNSLGHFKGVIPLRNEMLVAGEHTLHLVLDRKQAGDDACTLADRNPFPASDICLRTVEDFSDRDIGYFNILGPSPTGSALLLRTQNGPVYTWRKGGKLEPLLGGKSLYAHTAHRLPWNDHQTLVTAAAGSMIIDTSGDVAPVYPNASTGTSSHELLGILPSINTILLKRSTSAFRFSQPRGLTAASFSRTPSAAVDVPWWRLGVAYSPAGLQTIDAAGQIADMPLTYQGAPVGRIFGASNALVSGPMLYAIARHRWVLFKGGPLNTRLFARGWTRIDESLAIEPVSSLSDRDWIYSVLDDPAVPHVLMATSRGFLVLGDDGSTRIVPGSPSTVIRTIQRSSATGALLVGGDDGLFSYANGIMQPLSPDSLDSIGSVRAIVDVPFSRLTLIEASQGTFALEPDGRLTQVAALGPGRTRGPIQVFPELNSVYALGKGFVYSFGTLQELGRVDQGGVCSRPL